MEKSKFFVDPILKSIVFDQNHLWMLKLIRTSEFQRLDKIRQLGTSSATFPAATHTRLAHSLGAYEITRRFINHLGLNKSFPKKADHLLVAALLHDLGHGPYSHAFEKYTGCQHEEYTKQIILKKDGEINKILIENNINPKQVVDILFNQDDCVWTSQLIDSQIDADRMDYLMRDSWYTGAAYGQINPQYLIGCSLFIKGKICFAWKAIAELENMLIGRYHMYNQVYNHPHSLKRDFVIQRMFNRVRDLYNQKYNFENRFNMLNLFMPYFKSQKFNVEQLLALNDSILASFIESLKYEKDLVLKNLYAAYINKDLVKIEAVDQKVKLPKNANKYLCDIIELKPTTLYRNKIEPIYIYDSYIDELVELSKVSPIISKLKTEVTKIRYLVKINTKNKK